jgi:ribosome-binding protein aMBF1 (putative translation factor)
MGRRKKHRGHFCWCCGRIRANERFSGRGHARHLCKDCAKLGKEEIDYRQAVRDIDGLLDWNGVVRRKQRKRFEPFLSHPDERVRRYAEQVAEEDARSRQAFRQEHPR